MRQSDRFRPTCFMFVTANKWRTPTIIFVFIESLACIRLSACHLFGGMMRVGRSCDSPVRVSGYCWKIIGQISVELTTAVIVRRCRLIMCVWVVFRGVQTTNNDTNAFDDDVKQVPLVDEGCDESPMIGSINPTLARWVLHNTTYCTMDWLNSIFFFLLFEANFHFGGFSPKPMSGYAPAIYEAKDCGPDSDVPHNAEKLRWYKHK